MIGFLKDHSIEPRISRTRKLGGSFQENSYVLLYYILEGSATLKTGDLTFSEETSDFFVINTFDVWSLEGSENILCACFPIPYDVLPGVYNGTTAVFSCNSAGETGRENIQVLQGLLNRLLRCYVLSRQDRVLEERAQYEYCSWYFYMVGFLTARYLVLPGKNAVPASDGKAHHRMAQISAYLAEHYTEPVSLKDLADHLYLSPSYLARFFKQNYGMSLGKYLKKLRMDHAMSLLRFTKEPVSRIASDSGYPSISLFNRVFQETYGKTPTAVRKEREEEIETEKAKEKRQQEEDKGHEEKGNSSGAGSKEGSPQNDDLAKGETPPDETLVRMLMRDELPDFRRIRAEKLTCNCHAYSAVPLVPIWNITLNAGPARMLLRSDVQAQIRFLQERLHFQYARIWNVFSDEMLVVPDEGKVPNFSYLDKVIDFILDAGLLPHFDLEIKERRINYSSTKRHVLEKKAPYVFPSVRAWEDLIRSFRDHLIRRYSGDVVKKWRIELVYDGFRLRDEEPESCFFKLFSGAYHVIKKYLPEMQVGGCGYYPGYLPSSGEGEIFWSEWLRHAPAPDYVSLMAYAYEPDSDNDSGFGKRSMNPDYIRHLVDSVKLAQKKAGFPEREICITEWNLTVSDRNILNDTCFQGAYITRNMIAMTGSVRELSYFSAMDLLTEASDSTALLYGGNGLLSSGGLLKPSAYAHIFLQRLKENLITKDENYLVTTDRISWWNIICHNQKSLGYYYYASGEHELTHNDLWKVYDDRLPLEISFVIDDLPDAEYRIRTYRISPEHGSIYDIWKQFDFLEELNPDDIDAIRHEAAPFMTMKTKKVTNGRLLFDIRLQADEIALIRIERYFEKEG